MPRSVNAVASRARRKRILKAAKGFYGKRKNVYTVAKNVLEKGLTYRYVGRKLKKRDYRALWIVRINAAVRAEGLTYSEFMHKLHEKGIGLDRKVLADLAMNEPETFKPAGTNACSPHRKIVQQQSTILPTGCLKQRPVFYLNNYANNYFCVVFFGVGCSIF